MKLVLPEFFNFFKKKNNSDVKISDIILNNVFSNINFMKEYFEILEKFSKAGLLPKDKFYNIYHKRNPFNENQGLHSLNFVNRLTPDIIFKDKYYPNRKIYYLLNEYENIIYFKFIDKLLGSNITKKYSNVIVELLNELEEKEIKNLEINSSITIKDIKEKFSDVKNFLKIFENKLNKEIDNYSIKSNVLNYLKENYDLDNLQITKFLLKKNSFISNKFNKLKQILKSFESENKTQLKIESF